MKAYKFLFIFFFLFFTIPLMAEMGNSPEEAYGVGFWSKSFTYTHTQNTAAAGYSNRRGVYPTNDVFYSFALTEPMDITISHCGSELSNTYIMVYKYDISGVEYIGSISRNHLEENCLKSGQAYLKLKDLPVGSYWVGCKGQSENGKITTKIQGYKPAPIVYDVGRFTEPFTFTHTGNTIGGTNFNKVTSYNDLYYQFRITEPMSIEVNHEGSELSCTAISLLDVNYGIMDFMHSGCNNPVKHGTFKYQNLRPGTYYIVSSGLLSNGEITTTILCEKPYWRDLGEKRNSFTYTHTADTRGGINMWNIYPNSDMFYEIKTTKNANFFISNQDSELEYTSISMRRKDDPSTSWIASVKNSNNHTENFNWLEVENLPPDTYLVMVEGILEDGIITTTIEVDMNPDIKDNCIRTRTYIYQNDYEYLDNYQYFTGLGYSLLGIQKEITPEKKDLISIQEYDLFGREDKTWLPIVLGDDNDYGDFINIKKNARSEFMYNDESPYSKPVYEESPLNRVVRQYGPGEEWHHNGRAVSTDYMVNNSQFQCHRYVIEDDTEEIKLSQVKMYEAGELYVTKVSDEENKNITYQFTNKSGQLLLTRQLGGDTQLNTYYVYDSYGNLRVVLPPLAVDLLPMEDVEFQESLEQFLMSASLDTLIWTPIPGIKFPKDSLINIPGEVIQVKVKWDETSPTLQQYAYLYKYDHRNRCIAKKLPGCDWIYYIYDKKDRLIFSQDGEMGERGEWLFNIPDALGRPVLTGICKNYLTPTEHEVDKLVITANYTGAENSYKGYTVTGITLFMPEIQTVNYYDNYNFLSLPEYSALTYETPENGYGNRYTESSKGLLTGMYSAIAGDESLLLASAMYYDDRARVIQTQSLNHSGGKESEYTAYNFVGQPIQTKQVHTATLKGQTTTHTEQYTYTYDHAGRLLQVTHQLNDRTPVLLTQNQYDELGRLSTTKINGHNTLETSFNYNVRSWTKKIDAGSLFKEELNYTPSGNISEMKWSHAGDKRLYQYAYDDLSRLISATYSLPAAEGSGYSSAYSSAYGASIPNKQEVLQRNYNTAYTYDKHGNIQSLMRYGRLSESPVSFGVVDNLTMSYEGNQLMQVINSSQPVEAGNNSSFKDFTGGSGEYHYNSNGALIKDSHKGIVDIKYNFLNLPHRMDIKSPIAEARNEYLYSATGAKLRVTQKWNPDFDPAAGTEGEIDESKLSEEKVTDYIGNKIYENGELKMVLVPGGYYDAEKEKYFFYLSDHLGNNRVVVNEEGEVVQETHYYPFGATFAESTGEEEQPYKYNGKELDSKHGLNLYDYSARYYEPSIGRFTTMDPLAEKGYAWSPYVYCFNNPMIYIDPMGEWPNWSQLRQKARNTIGVGLSVASGAIVAISDNIAGGHTDFREIGEYSNATAYNIGQDIGDGLSILVGGAEMLQGVAMTTGGNTLTALSGGTSSLATVPVAATGVAIAAHGSVMATSGSKNLSNQKGRAAVENNSDVSSKKHKNPKKVAREEAKSKRDNQPASEEYAKYKARELEKNQGKDARRKAHDSKDKIGRDRTKNELDEDYWY